MNVRRRTSLLSRRRRLTAILAVTLGGALVLLGGLPANAAPSVDCTTTGDGTYNVTVTAGLQTVTFSRQGSEIWVEDAVDSEHLCSSATTNNTELIIIESGPVADTAGGLKLEIDLRTGAFAPLASPTDEVKFQVTLPEAEGSGSTTRDELRVIGSNSVLAPDHIAFAAGGLIDLNDDGDVDILQITNAERVQVLLGGGADVVTSDGDTTSPPYPTLDIVGGDGNDTISGTDMTTGQEIQGGNGDDTLTGGSGNDAIAGEGGIDTIDGGGGNDNAELRLDSDFTGLYGGDDGDTINGSDGADHLWGGAGEDTLNGGADNDILHGGDDKDVLNGNSGDDELDGDAGDDTLNGDAGRDLLDERGAIDKADPGEESAGDDILNGGLEDDDEYGGDGGDTFVQDQPAIDDQGDDIVGGGGTDVVDYSSRTGDLEITLGGSGGTEFNDGEVIGSASESDRVNVENAKGGSGDDIITGHPEATQVSGGTANELWGGPGDDQLSGGRNNGDPGTDFDGADTLHGEAGNDVLAGGFEADTLDGGDGNDELLGNAGNDELDGGQGNDTLEGGTGDDLLYEGVQKNGADVLSGGADEDTVTYQDRTSPVIVTVAAGNGNDGEAGEGDTVLDAEIVAGGAGADELHPAEAGGTTLDGRGGNDRLFSGPLDDILIGGDGSDWADFSQSANGVVVMLEPPAVPPTPHATGHGDDELATIENVTGTDDRDEITGDDGPNILQGLGGDDTLNGEGGNDVLMPGLGDDISTVNGGDGSDTVSYADVAAAVTVSLETAEPQDTKGAGTDTIAADIENVTGGQGNDTLTGNDQANVISGLGGTDTVNYSSRTTAVNVSLDDVANDGTPAAGETSGEGDNVLSDVENILAGSGNDTLTGSSSANLLSGGAGNDLLNGRGGNDIEDGGAGNDRFDQEASFNGNDTLNGSDGTDTVDYTARPFIPTGEDTLIGIESTLGTVRAATNTTPSTPTGGAQGYVLVGGDGGIFTFGTATFQGSLGDKKLNAPIIGIAYMPGGTGYWLVAKDGGVFTFGDAQFFGSTGSMTLNAEVLGMESTPTGKGYWLYAADGGIFTFGDAKFFGSTGSMKLNAPMIGMAVTEAGDGYWLVAQDGGIFTFGGAPFHGSTGSMKLNQPVFDMAPAAGDAGYWLVARDGGVFTFGNIPFYGSAANVIGRGTVIGMGDTPAGKGYWIADANGKVMPFGDALFLGDRSTAVKNAPMVAFATVQPKG